MFFFLCKANEFHVIVNLKQIQDFRNGGSLYGLLRVVPFSGGRVGGGGGGGGPALGILRENWISSILKPSQQIV